MTFRIQAKKIFVTYAQCTLTREAVYEFINEKHPVQKAIVCIEAHADGTPHLHAAVWFKRKVQITNPRIFDIEGFHPSIESTRNWSASVTYVKKDGNFLEWLNDDEGEYESIYDLAETMTSKEFFDYCLMKKVPYAYADRAWKSRDSMFTINSSEHPGRMREDLSVEECIDDGERSLVIRGGSGIGKTTWAKIHSKKPALFVSHMDTLRQLTREHQCIIFDDISFLHLHREAQIAILDRYDPRAIHVRYTTVDIPAGIQKIFTCNNEIFDRNDAAISRRLRQINFI